VSADAPAVGVPLVPQPIVAEDLGVEVVGLEGRVMDVEFRALEEEEAVVVHALLAAVQPVEYRDVLVVGVVGKLRHPVLVRTQISPPSPFQAHLAREEVESGRVEVVRLGEVGHAEAKVAQLVDGRRPLLEPLESIRIAVLLQWLG
jgi:hypothetical protein